jgi:hypothetical protein
VFFPNDYPIGDLQTRKHMQRRINPMVVQNKPPFRWLRTNYAREKKKEKKKKKHRKDVNKSMSPKIL